MTDPRLPAVLELGATRFQLRADLNFAPSIEGDIPYFIVEDGLNSRFYRLGRLEHAFVTLLDGQRSLRDAYSEFSRRHPDHHLSENDAISLCRWLVEMELASTSMVLDTQRHSKLAESHRIPNWWKTMNPLLFKLPMGNPDGWLKEAAARIGFLFSPWAVFGWIVLLISGFYSIANDWHRFSNASKGIFGSDNWIWLGLSWILLKVLHELAHGIACKRLGGSVREAGLMFMFFAPLAYVDVTSTWRFRSRWHRIQVALAGMYCELAVAALCSMVWSQTTNPWLENFCYNTIVMASLATIVVNANPLMKFDGYYIFSDALCLPNLYSNGQAILQYWVRRYLFGLPSRLTFLAGRSLTLIQVYAILALCWRITVCAGLVVASVTMFHGAGVVLSILALTTWVALPFGRGLSLWIGECQPKQRIRSAGIISFFAMAIAAMFLWVPWPGSRSAPAIVEYREPSTLRADSPGFLRTIHVEDGQVVKAGQLLLNLENDQLLFDLQSLEFQIRQSEIRERTFELNGKQADRQAEMERAAGLKKQLAERADQVSKMTVVAPRDGRVIMRGLSHRLGMYFDQGDELLIIGDESEKELRLSLSQDDVQAFHQNPNQELCVAMSDRGHYRCRLTSIQPRATVEPTHPAFLSVYGGVLPVTEKSGPSDEEPSGYELLTPRFTALVSLPIEESQQVGVGEVAHVSYRPLDMTIGTFLYRWASQWIRQSITDQN